MRETELKIEEIPIDELVPYENNAKKHTREQIDAVEASIKEFGFRNPVIVWRNADGRPEVVAGHARVTAAKNIGMKKVPCVSCDELTDAQRRAYTLADNQTTMMTGWDEDMLAYELDVLDQEFDMSDFGFTDEASAMPDSPGAEEVDAQEDVEPMVRRGEVWSLGGHRLMCGDATSREDVERLMDGSRADICFTSPPYNVGTFQVGKTSGEMYVKKDRGRMYDGYSDDLSDSDYRDFLCESLDTALSVCDDALFNIGYTSGALSGSAAFIGRNAARFGGAIIWKKSAAFQPFFPSQHGIMTNVCEPIYVFNADGTRKLHHPQWEQGSYVPNVIETKNASSDNDNAGEHEATFPVALPYEVISMCSEASVLDLFGGTGTTLIAAEQLGRTCYMMEIDPHYCDVIIARWESMTGKKAELVSDD